MRKILLIIATVVVCSVVAQAAIVTWDGGGSDNNWNTGHNWDTGVPGSGDNAVIGSATVDVNANTEVTQIKLGGGGSDTATLNVNSALLYYDAFGSSDWGISGDTINVNINSGGTLDGGGSAYGSRIDGYSTITINSGGVMQNIYRQRISTDIVLNGGTMFLAAASGAVTSSSRYQLEGGGISGSSGTIVFPVAGDGLRVAVGPSAGTTFDIAQLTVQVDIADGYTPQAGDSFDLFDSPSATTDIGDGSNVSNISADGLWQFTWDTSSWDTPTGKGVLTIDSVIPIPEPATVGMLGLGAVVAAAVRRLKG